MRVILTLNNKGDSMSIIKEVIEGMERELEMERGRKERERAEARAERIIREGQEQGKTLDEIREDVERV